jgi:hypothetical protein
MENQDPTAETDPNEYINQLVQVNSLEQLISINQNLSTVLGVASSSEGGTSGSAAPGAGDAATSAAHPKGPPGLGPVSRTVSNPASGPAPNPAGAIQQFAESHRGGAGGTGHAPGNLGVPADKPAAHRVANALDGHAHARSTSPTRPRNH